MRKIIKIISVAVAPVVAILTFLSGCINLNSKPVEIDNGGIMQDIDLKPAQEAAYEQYSRQALDEYRQVASAHTDADGEVNFEDEQVRAAASSAAAKLYAYACYNERTLDKYVFFSNQKGDTDLGKMGSATACRQEYYLRVNEGADTCGYRYHYTIKKVTQSSGTAMSTAKGFFESARIRMTDKTDLLYRFEGTASTIKLSEDTHNTLGCELLSCDWSTGSDWGKPDVAMRKGEFISPDKIEEDIVASAGEDNFTIRGNINILAENIVQSATILESDEGVIVIMNINTDVANSDEASLKMLRNANGSDDCVWVKGSDSDDTGLTIIFALWENGLFRSYSISERWEGTISAGPFDFEGKADSETSYYYSYSDRDCDMTANLAMLETAKTARGN